MVSNIFKLNLLCVIVFIIAACSQSKAQHNFEDQALSKPAGIMAMNAQGAPAKNGEKDSDDWRISPHFSGLVEVTTPAFPNPVAYNASIEIDLRTTAIDVVNGLYIYAFQRQSELGANPIFIRQQPLQAGIQPIRLRPSQFAPESGTGSFGNIYRIIMYDGQNNIITYGDVLVQ